jgi:hypothetical protein
MTDTDWRRVMFYGAGAATAIGEMHGWLLGIRQGFAYAICMAIACAVINWFESRKSSPTEKNG